MSREDYIKNLQKLNVSVLEIEERLEGYEERERIMQEDWDAIQSIPASPKLLEQQKLIAKLNELMGQAPMIKIDVHSITAKETTNFQRYWTNLFGCFKGKGKIYLMKMQPQRGCSKNKTDLIVKDSSFYDVYETLKNETGNDWYISQQIYNQKSDKFTVDKKNIVAMYTFYCEFDYGKDGHKNNNQPFASKESCLDAIKSNYSKANLMPSMVFFSGHGFHCYWCVTDNLIGNLSHDDIENANEKLFQIGVGDSNGKFFNEVKNVNQRLRSPFPACNLKTKQAVKTNILFPKKDKYSLTVLLEELDKQKIVVPIKTYVTTNAITGGTTIQDGDIQLLENDGDFMGWLGCSNDLNYYLSEEYAFPSTSEKQYWIYKYLYKCGLDSKQIYDFCRTCFDNHYNLITKHGKDGEQSIAKQLQCALSKQDKFPNIKPQHRKDTTKIILF